MSEKKFKPATCHPERSVRAKGLCRACYSAQDYQKHKAKRDAAHQQYRESNRDIINAGNRRWREENREQYDLWRTKYQSENREALNAAKTAWREANRDLENARARERYAQDREAVCAYHREWRAANRDKLNARTRERSKTDLDYKRRQRGYQLMFNYGLSLSDYDGLYKFQNHWCAICEMPCPDRKFLSVDHDHDTKQIRGLLCNPCNRGIGHFKSMNLATIGGKIGEYLSNPPYPRYIELSAAQTPAE